MPQSSSTTATSGKNVSDKLSSKAANKGFNSVNINSIYKGKSLGNTQKTPLKQHGLQSLGKISAVRRMPPPAYLPSVKSENPDHDIKLVPEKGSGWGTSPQDKLQESSDKSISTPALENSSRAGRGYSNTSDQAVGNHGGGGPYAPHVVSGGGDAGPFSASGPPPSSSNKASSAAGGGGSTTTITNSYTNNGNHMRDQGHPPLPSFSNPPHQNQINRRQAPTAALGLTGAHLNREFPSLAAVAGEPEVTGGRGSGVGGKGALTGAGPPRETTQTDKQSSGASNTTGSTTPTVNTAYGPGPSLRPQTEGNWSRGLAGNTPGNGGGAQNPGGGGKGGLNGMASSSDTSPSQRTDLIGGSGGGSGNYPAIQSQAGNFMGSTIPPMVPGRALFPIPFPHGFQFTQDMIPPPRPAYSVHSQKHRIPIDDPSRPRIDVKVVTDKDLKTFDYDTASFKDDWSNVRKEIDYNATLDFDDEDNNTNNRQQQQQQSQQDQDGVKNERHTSSQRSIQDSNQPKVPKKIILSKEREVEIRQSYQKLPDKSYPQSNRDRDNDKRDPHSRGGARERPDPRDRGDRPDPRDRGDRPDPRDRGDRPDPRDRSDRLDSRKPGRLSDEPPSRPTRPSQYDKPREPTMDKYDGPPPSRGDRPQDVPRSILQRNPRSGPPPPRAEEEDWRRKSSNAAALAAADEGSRDGKRPPRGGREAPGGFTRKTQDNRPSYADDANLQSSESSGQKGSGKNLPPRLQRHQDVNRSESGRRTESESSEPSKAMKPLTILKPPANRQELTGGKRNNLPEAPSDRKLSESQDLPSSMNDSQNKSQPQSKKNDAPKPPPSVVMNRERMNRDRGDLAATYTRQESQGSDASSRSNDRRPSYTKQTSHQEEVKIDEWRHERPSASDSTKVKATSEVQGGGDEPLKMDEPIRPIEFTPSNKSNSGLESANQPVTSLAGPTHVVRPSPFTTPPLGTIDPFKNSSTIVRTGPVLVGSRPTAYGPPPIKAPFSESITTTATATAAQQQQQQQSQPQPPQQATNVSRPLPNPSPAASSVSSVSVSSEPRRGPPGVGDQNEPKKPSILATPMTTSSSGSIGSFEPVGALSKSSMNAVATSSSVSSSRSMESAMQSMQISSTSANTQPAPPNPIQKPESHHEQQYVQHPRAQHHHANSLHNQFEGILASPDSQAQSQGRPMPPSPHLQHPGGHHTAGHPVGHHGHHPGHSGLQHHQQPSSHAPQPPIQPPAAYRLHGGVSGDARKMIPSPHSTTAINGGHGDRTPPNIMSTSSTSSSGVGGWNSFHGPTLGQSEAERRSMVNPAMSWSGHPGAAAAAASLLEQERRMNTGMWPGTHSSAMATMDMSTDGRRMPAVTNTWTNPAVSIAHNIMEDRRLASLGGWGASANQMASVANMFAEQERQRLAMAWSSGSQVAHAQPPPPPPPQQVAPPHHHSWPSQQATPPPHMMQQLAAAMNAAAAAGRAGPPPPLGVDPMLRQGPPGGPPPPGHGGHMDPRAHQMNQLTARRPEPQMNNTMSIGTWQGIPNSFNNAS